MTPNPIRNMLDSIHDVRTCIIIHDDQRDPTPSETSTNITTSTQSNGVPTVTLPTLYTTYPSNNNLHDRRSIYINGVSFYPFLNKKNRVNLFDSASYTTSSFVVAKDHYYPGSKEKKSIYAAFPSSVDFYIWLRNIPFINRCFYEVIPVSYGDEVINETFDEDHDFKYHRAQKPHWDIDIDMKKEDANFLKYSPDELALQSITNLKQSICHELSLWGINISDTNFIVTNSHRHDKRSFHLVVNKYRHPNPEQARTLYNLVITHIPEHLRKYIDFAVYKKNQQFRILGNHKIGIEGAKILDPITTWTPPPDNGFSFTNIVNRTYLDIWSSGEYIDQMSLLQYFNASLITNTSECIDLPSFTNVPQVHMPKKINPIINWLQSKGITIDTSKNVGVPKVSSKGLDCSDYYDEIVSAFHKSELSGGFSIGDISSGILNLSRKHPSYCPICKRVHEHENSYITLSIIGYIKWHCWRSSEQNLSHIIGRIDIIPTSVENSEIVDQQDEDVSFGDFIGGFDLRTGKLVENIPKEVVSVESNVQVRVPAHAIVGTVGSVMSNLQVRVPAHAIGGTVVVGSNAATNQLVNIPSIRDMGVPKVATELLVPNELPQDFEAPILTIWPSYCDVTNISVEFLPHYDIKQQILCVKSPMETRKTVESFDYLTRLIANYSDYDIVIVSTRRSYTRDAVPRFSRGTNVNFVSYLDNTADDTKYYVTQVESCHKDSTHRKIVVLDEFRSLLEQFNSPHHGNNLYNNRKTFEDYISNAEYVLALDADFDEHCVSVIHSLRPNDRINLVVNTFQKRVGYTIIEYLNFYEFLNALGNSLSRQDNRVVVPTNSYTFGNTVRHLFAPRNLRFYSSKEDDRPDELADINNAIRGFDAVFYTSTLGSGVDINVPHFHEMFLYVHPKSCCARDVVQMMGRIRNLIDMRVHIFVQQQVGRKPDTFNSVLHDINMKINMTNNETKKVVQHAILHVPDEMLTQNTVTNANNLTVTPTNNTVVLPIANVNNNLIANPTNNTDRIHNVIASTVPAINNDRVQQIINDRRLSGEINNITKVVLPTDTIRKLFNNKYFRSIDINVWTTNFIVSLVEKNKSWNNMHEELFSRLIPQGYNVIPNEDVLEYDDFQDLKESYNSCKAAIKAGQIADWLNARSISKDTKKAQQCFINDGQASKREKLEVSKYNLLAKFVPGTNLESLALISTEKKLLNNIRNCVAETRLTLEQIVFLDHRKDPLFSYDKTMISKLAVINRIVTILGVRNSFDSENIIDSNRVIPFCLEIHHEFNNWKRLFGLYGKQPKGNTITPYLRTLASVIESWNGCKLKKPDCHRLEYKIELSMVELPLLISNYILPRTEELSIMVPSTIISPDNNIDAYNVTDSVTYSLLTSTYVNNYFRPLTLNITR